jgi:hypothetical protein
MFSRLRKRVTYTNVAMTLAFVFAMTGGAYAASKYVITSTKQIKPSVLTALKGKAGNTGPAGAKGETGAAGPAGAKGETGAAGAKGETGAKGDAGSEGPEGKKGEEGKPGPAGAKGATGATGPQGPLQSGKTETGMWSFSTGEKNQVIASISFTLPLQKELGETEVEYVESGSTTKCPGTVKEPSATPGNLCVYQDEANGVTSGHLIVPSIAELISSLEKSEPAKQGARESGAVLFFTKNGTDEPYGDGTWAVTEK